MEKNFNLENAKNVIAAHRDVPVNTTLGGVTKPIDLLFEVIDMNADLIALIREEAELKKHHRAYLHVREELEDCTDWISSRMLDILDEARDCVFGLAKDVRETFHAREREAENADTVTIPKEDYETMIDDLLVMSELIQMVSDMRTRDMEIIQEMGKLVPAFAAFEKNRLSLYRGAAKEAEEIFDRWADEYDVIHEDEDDEFEVYDIDVDALDDEDYEPDEYFSD